jgi:mRNA interferase YafQ
MLKIKYTNQFKKDYRKIKSTSYNLKDLETVIELLVSNKNLNQKYKDHNLNGNLKDFRECHIKPDWLLIYRVDYSKRLLILITMGSHSELYKS